MRIRLNTTIIINPGKQTIWLCKLQPKKWYDLTRGECPGHMPIHDNLGMTRNITGLIEVCEKPAKAKRGFFVYVDHNETPLELVVGRGVIGAGVYRGSVSTLPENVTPKDIAKHIRFIPPANYTAAVKLSAEI